MFDLNKVNFGQNLVWFFGVVENRMDPNFLGRIQVRCYGHHTSNRLEIPTEDLPWAMVMQPVTSAAQTDVGESPTGIVEGSWVVGFFIDGEEAQQPLVIGTLGGYANKPEKLSEDEADDWHAYGFKDVREEDHLAERGFPSPPVSVRKKTESGELGAEIVENPFVQRYPRKYSQNKSTVPKLARGVRDLNIFLNEDTSFTTTKEEKTKVLQEPMLSKMLNENASIQTSKPGLSYAQPTSPYNAQYPFNHVKETESGHIVEFDDTPGAERIHEYHRSGTFREIHPDGTLVSQTMDEKYDLTEASSYEYAKGEKFETFRKGMYTMINAGRFGGEDYEVRVCGSANYNLTVEEGDINVKTTTGQINLITSSLKLLSPNEIKTASPYIEESAGDLVCRVENEHRHDVDGMYVCTAGYINQNAAMNYSVSAGDNYTLEAAHTVKIHAENTFTMPPFYVPWPIGVKVSTAHGHIEMNAMDGNTRISARGFGWVTDTGNFTVTSSLPTSIASLMQYQPSPFPGLYQHMSHPASIISSTITGYIYNESWFGDIVSDAKFMNSVRMRATPKGMVEEMGGMILHTATSSDIINIATRNFFVAAGQGVYTNSGWGTHINSAQEIFVTSGTTTTMTSVGPTMIASIGATVHLGSHAAHEPALKGPSFLKTFFAHTHLTPMGPTTPVDFVTNPQLGLWAAQSLCLKTMVF